jgi:hypothetical protein
MSGFQPKISEFLPTDLHNRGIETLCRCVEFSALIHNVFDLLFTSYISLPISLGIGRRKPCDVGVGRGLLWLNRWSPLRMTC